MNEIIQPNFQTIFVRKGASAFQKFLCAKLVSSDHHTVQQFELGARTHETWQNFWNTRDGKGLKATSCPLSQESFHCSLIIRNLSQYAIIKCLVQIWYSHWTFYRSGPALSSSFMFVRTLITFANILSTAASRWTPFPIRAFYWMSYVIGSSLDPRGWSSCSQRNFKTCIWVALCYKPWVDNRTFRLLSPIRLKNEIFLVPLRQTAWHPAKQMVL